MTDYSEFLDNDDGIISNPDSPFYGLPTSDVKTAVDPYVDINTQVLDVLGITDFTEVTVDFENVLADRLRGNRFANIVDAIVYLNEAGILSFSNVTIDDTGEIGIAIGYIDD